MKMPNQLSGEFADWVNPFEDIDLSENTNEFSDWVNPFEVEPVIEKSIPEPVEKQKGNTASELFSAYGVGSNSLLKIAGDIYGLTFDDMDNWASNAGKSGIDYWEKRKSKNAKDLEKQRKDRIDFADGMLSKAGVAFWETITSPTLLTMFAFEQAPMLITTGGVGKLAGALTKTTGALKTTQATAAVGGAIGAGAVMHGADSGADSYDQLLALPDNIWLANPRVKSRVDAGEPLGAVKEDIAIGLSRNTAIAAGITSIGLNMVPGARYLEKSLVGVKIPGSKGLNAAIGFAGGALAEGIEEGSGKFFANLASKTIDPSTDLSKGVGEASGMGAVLGGFAGGGAGYIASSNKTQNAVDKIAVAKTNEEVIEAAREGVSEESKEVPLSEADRINRNRGIIESDIAENKSIEDYQLTQTIEDQGRASAQDLSAKRYEQSPYFNESEAEIERQKAADYDSAVNQVADRQIESSLEESTREDPYTANPVMREAFQEALNRKSAIEEKKTADLAEQDRLRYQEAPEEAVPELSTIMDKDPIPLDDSISKKDTAQDEVIEDQTPLSILTNYAKTADNKDKLLSYARGRFPKSDLSKEIDLAWRAKTEGKEDVLFSSTMVSEEGQSGISVDKVTSAIKPALKNLNVEVGIDLEIVSKPEDLGLKKSNAKGAFYKGKIYLFSDNIKDEKDANLVLAHELVGHKGVIEMSSKEQWEDITNTVNRLTTLKNKMSLDIMAEVDERYPGANSETRVKEFLAIAAERRIERGPIAKLIAKFREITRSFLKKVGIKKIFSESEIDIILSNSERYIRGKSEIESVNDQLSQAKETGFQGEDITEANEWQQAFEKFGPEGMTEKARLSRAKEMGFDTEKVYYHGTSDDFTEFQDSDMSGMFTDRRVSFFTTDTKYASSIGDRVIPVYLSVDQFKEVGRDGYSISKDPEFIEALIKNGDTGVFTNDGMAIAFYPSKIRSTNAAFDPDFRESENLLYSKDKEVTANKQSFSKKELDVIKKGGFGKKSFKNNFTDQYNQTREHLNTKFRQGFVDQYASFKDILKDEDAWMLGHLTKSNTGAIESLVEDGSLVLRGGVIGVDTKSKSLKEILIPLGEDLDRWTYWIAGNRANKLKKEGKENLFSDKDISIMMAMNKGKEQLFDSVKEEFELLADSVSRIAVDTGLLSKEEVDSWLQEGFYLPFYRVSEDDVSFAGPHIGSSGLVRQQAYKKLKGGTQKIDDLLGNALLNWNHLISASLNNQAARKAMESAEKMGLASRASKRTKGKKAVYVRVDGKEQWWDLDESQEGRIVLDSLKALNWQGLNGRTMRAGRAFKRVLTFSVTVNPEFKIRNLMRDTVQAIAVADMSTQIHKNLYQGFKETAKNSEARKQALAGGAIFGDSGYIHGADPEAIKYLVNQGVKRDTILDTRWRVKKVFDAYQDFGARLENLNRMANYVQDMEKVKEGKKTILEATFNARDHLDFTRTGSFLVVRGIAQLAPFLNARMQGMDKMIRAGMSTKQRAQFFAVQGVYSSLSVLLYLSIRGDKDYEEAEEWERDSYHMFKVPGSEILYKYPRPFESGAIAALAERVVEQMVNDEAHGELFAERLSHILAENLSMNPTPQALKPALELAMNKNWFTGRAIESMGMRNLSNKNKKSAWTSETAIAFSQGMDKITWGQVVLSPVQIEHLVRGYLGWLGSNSLAAADMLVSRPLTDAPSPPAKRFTDYPIIKAFAKSGPTRNTKYNTVFYERLKQVDQAFADIQQARKLGDIEEQQRVIEKSGKLIPLRKYYNARRKDLSKINLQMKLIRLSKLTPEEKRLEMDRMLIMKNRLTKIIDEKTKDLF